MHARDFCHERDGRVSQAFPCDVWQVVATRFRAEKDRVFLKKTPRYEIAGYRLVGGGGGGRGTGRLGLKSPSVGSQHGRRFCWEACASSCEQPRHAHFLQWTAQQSILPILTSGGYFCGRKIFCQGPIAGDTMHLTLAYLDTRQEMLVVSEV